MSNELLKRKNWLQRNWSWTIPLVVVLILSFSLFFSLTAGHLGDLGKAYAEPQLYAGALEIVQQNKQVTALLGQLEPIGKMAILEGEIDYSNEDCYVDLWVRITGTKGKAGMSVTAKRINNKWEYEKISIRIKNPPEERQNIIVK